MGKRSTHLGVWFFFSPDCKMGRSTMKVLKLCPKVLGLAGGTGGQEGSRAPLGLKQMNKQTTAKELGTWEKPSGLPALCVATLGPISAGPPCSRPCEAIIFLERPRNTTGSSRDWAGLPWCRLYLSRAYTQLPPLPFNAGTPWLTVAFSMVGDSGGAG